MAAVLIISEMVCGMLPVSYVVASEDPDAPMQSESVADEACQVPELPELQQNSAGEQLADEQTSETVVSQEAVSDGNTAVAGEPAEDYAGDAGASEEIPEMPQDQTVGTEEFEVRFELNGLGNAMDSIMVQAGSLLEKPEDPAAEGYQFAGWYADPELTIPWDFDLNPVTQAVSLYAKWEIITDENENGGEIAVSEGSQDSEEKTADEENTADEQNTAGEENAAVEEMTDGEEDEDGAGNTVIMDADTAVSSRQKTLGVTDDPSENEDPESEDEEDEEELLTNDRPEIVVMTDGVAGDGSAPKIWGPDLMNLTKTKEDAQKAIDQGLLNTTVTVAVIDTGINEGHEWFEGRISKDSKSFIHDDEPKNYNDENGHGTHVAGIIADNTPSNVSLLILQALDAEKKGTAADVVAAIEYAVANGARIINLSLGVTANDFEDPAEYSDYVTRLDTALVEAENAGAAVIVSAGNAGADIDASGAFPAGSEHVITVSAIDENKNKYAYSNYGNAVNFCAPGVDIFSAWIGGSNVYAYLNGTSMATPFISAAYALEMLRDGSLSTGQVTGQLIESTGKPVMDAYYGYGFPSLNLVFTGDLSCPIINECTSNGTSVTLAWSAINGVSYSIYRKASTEINYQYLASSTTGNYLDENVECGVQYEYYIEANEEGYYSLSNQSPIKTVLVWTNVARISIVYEESVELHDDIVYLL